MKSLELVFFDAGGGHRSAANALSEVVRLEGRDWDVQLMNLQELLDEMDVFRKITGIRLQDIYNLMLRKGWTLGSPQLLPLMHGVIKMLHGQQVSMLEKYWKGKNLDMVVSVIPNFNRALFQGMAKALPGVPMVTILTDMADYPPSFWIEKQPQYLICGTEKARQQALAMGHAKERVFLTSGMILNPKYYQPVDVDRVPELEALGLDPKLPTALMMFGGEGSARMLDIARQLNASTLDLQMIAICGKNEKLRRELQNMPRRIPMHIEGFTREVPRFMRLSDFFIGKPGPGSISEAVAMGLPVIVECNAWTLPQERYNASWVEERGVGIALKSFSKGIVEAAGQMVDSRRRAEFSGNVKAISNRAVYEIPEILAGILASH
ncbi:MAG: galactosyldiacylglycerol synthase [Acidobacteriia bacterium]|nr:galactosyldiacylglycerol synthase [Terriglobia bacterium]